ncbi:UDP-N-acetylglucosamine 4,6-dehydratase (inverting) [Hyphomicrobium sp.]|uniref:UDP-N-acetylglucosamine 4,6-dehydratase (inverting) n=1 Tax=Hyphomicrobium sp. TaxID=82 RepID=UPI0025C1C4E3|nr:UDP-N-acetylglucosamine 4,6-dehydratase (inverting) [Hyphomicrobium sp.]MCC7250962.1 UDP-N-acetylglucosamine 4,6-dehydratase (inverting) [Hyphomicrobium sp.]
MTSFLDRTFDRPAFDPDEQSIMVTGGTGSFGRAFVRKLLSMPKPPRRLVVFSRDEQKQDTMARELRSAFSEDLFGRLRFFIGDVRDVARLELAMRDVQVVVHAAALKIVPTAEYNPFECILTNVHGAENIVKASLRSGVAKVVALSTDKAANPVNLYGASKLAADKIMVAANNLSGDDGARYSVVRYGNVIGSRGSVVPLFQDMLSSGAKSLPITDPRMTRFWITLQQGVAFVLSSLEMMRGGEIFVPKIPSMKMTDLAEAIASGIPYDVIGIRPGEKLHEVMITEDDARVTIELPDRYVICPGFSVLSWNRAHLDTLGAVPVSEGFRYSSDANIEWLSAAGLSTLISSAGATD